MCREIPTHVGDYLLRSLRACYCPTCGETFSCEATFAVHQTASGCADPRTFDTPSKKMEPRVKHGVTVWGWPTPDIPTTNA